MWPKKIEWKISHSNTGLSTRMIHSWSYDCWPIQMNHRYATMGTSGSPSHCSLTPHHPILLWLHLLGFWPLSLPPSLVPCLLLVLHVTPAWHSVALVCTPPWFIFPLCLWVVTSPLSAGLSRCQFQLWPSGQYPEQNDSRPPGETTRPCELTVDMQY